MISKELFSEVMNIKIEDIVDLKMFGKELNYYEKCLLNFCCDGRLSKYKDSICKSVNIYELAHKCKEWIIQEGLSYTVYYDDSFKNYICEILEENCNDGIEPIGNTFVSSTEIQSVFSSCQWMIDNKKQREVY